MNKSSRKIKEEIRISGGKAAPVHVPAYKKQIEENLEVSTTDLLAVIFSGAVSLGASDIHIEPSEKEVEMRIRLDGMLHPVLKFDKKTYKRISSRLKLISGLKLNISDRPQDGRFTVVLEKKDLNIEIRISSLPAEHGETFVMRILNPEALREIEKLGLREDLLKEVKKAIKQPHGMILSTGPTGSGKTTTLYAFCKKINSPEKKIVTIEDPIEYHLEGISQTQVDPKKGYDFASGLRAIVRQDPDVILVGEMRDAETVNIALQAALTGHLVFSTLHTNSAAGVVTRLLSLKGKIANIGPALNIVLGQRLLRKVCEDCKKMRKVKNKELEKLKK